MLETTEMIKAIANDSKVRIDRIVANYEQLEKEKAELEDKLANADYQLEGRDIKIKELEKENAELKKELEMSNKVYNDNLDYSHHIEEQFTKAKVIIKELLSSCFGYNSKTVNYEVKAKAEQFISEVEK